jgi:hypothetical protein
MSTVDSQARDGVCGWLARMEPLSDPHPLRPQRKRSLRAHAPKLPRWGTAHLFTGAATAGAGQTKVVDYRELSDLSTMTHLNKRGVRAKERFSPGSIEKYSVTQSVENLRDSFGHTVILLITLLQFRRRHVTPLAFVAGKNCSLVAPRNDECK